MEKIPGIRFVPFERFAVKSEQKENPRSMPYLSYSLAHPDEENKKIVNNMIKEDLEKLFKESSVDKDLLELKPMRQFLKTAWQRDSYLYFNGTYFPWRWVDTKGQSRPERESYVLLASGLKENINFESILKRYSKNTNEAVFAMGEGGLYFPDHDNKTLFVSKGIVAEGNPLSSEETDIKIKEMHKKIFGEEIQVETLTNPDNTPHIDTHFSIIPNTKKALIENNYYEKLKKLNELKKLEALGYEPMQIPPSSLECPLNILYLENSSGKICAYLHPDIPPFVKKVLVDNKIEVYSMSKFLADVVDRNQGGMRCITNELNSKDPKFLNKMGFNEK